MRAALACLLALGAWVPPGAHGQLPADSAVPRVRVSRGVAPDTVTVGDRFRSFLRVDLPPGATVRFDSVATTDTLQQTDTLTVLAGDSGAVAVYPLVAWVAGQPLRAEVALVVQAAGASAVRYRVELRLPAVRSVLPATGEVVPRPPRALLPLPSTGPPSFWPWLILALTAIVAALLAWWLRRGRAPAAPGDPRAEALEQLDRLAADEAAAPADRFYARATRILREYIEHALPGAGQDLTSTELIAVLGALRPAPLDITELRDLLGHADPVKFARVDPGPAGAERFVGRVRAWVEANPPAAPLREAA